MKFLLGLRATAMGLALGLVLPLAWADAPSA